MPETPTGTGFVYRAFISYSHADRAACDWLHKALERYRVPSRLVGRKTSAGVIPRRLTPIFRDRDELPSATDLNQKVEQALRASAWLIVICSRHSATSPWVNQEVLAFKRMGRADRILCLVVDGEPNAVHIPCREAEECFCPALRHRVDANGALTDERSEPIAADARAGKDGRNNAKLKLIAGMLDVGLDALKQREQRRQLQRMTAIAALALIVMLVTSALAINAVFARNAAVSARRKAVVAEQAAERRQRQAEDLVNFMLGDLTTKLRQVDRLDILGSVDDKTMAYFKSLPVSDVNAITLAQRAKTLQKIGDVRMNQTKLPDAMDAFQQALRINQRLVQLSPDDPARQNAYGENLLWIGFDYWQQDKLDRTESSFAQAATALERAAARAPADNDVQHNLDDIYNNLGFVAQARGELDSASADFAKDLALDQRMAKQRPGDIRWQKALSDAYGALGNVALARGRLVEAVAHDLEQQRLIARVVERNPGDRQLQDQLLQNDGALARVLELGGRTQAAADYAASATQIGEALVKFDPSHTDWQDNYALYSQWLGGLRLQQGDPAAAAGPITMALKAEARLLARDPTNANWRRDLAEAQLQAARLALARKQSRNAQRLALQASATMQKLLTGVRPKVDSIRIQTDIELVLAGVARDGKDHARQALDRMRPIAAHSLDPRDLSRWAAALLANGDKAQARPVVERLRKTGFRPLWFVALLKDRGIAYPSDEDAAHRLAEVLDSAAKRRYANASARR